jgi:hypothetical protein
MNIPLTEVHTYHTLLYELKFATHEIEHSKNIQVIYEHQRFLEEGVYLISWFFRSNSSDGIFPIPGFSVLIFLDGVSLHDI